MENLSSILFLFIISFILITEIYTFDFYKCSGVKPVETPKTAARGLWYLTWASRAGEQNRKNFYKNNHCGIFKNCNDCACLAMYIQDGTEDSSYYGYSMASNIKEKKTYVKSYHSRKIMDNNLAYYKAVTDYEAELPYSEQGYSNDTDKFETKNLGDFYKYVLLDTDDNKSWRIHLVCEDTKDITQDAQPLILVYTKSKNPGKQATMKAVLDALGKNGLNAHALELSFYDHDNCKWPTINEFKKCKWGCNCMEPPKKLPNSPEPQTPDEATE